MICILYNYLPDGQGRFSYRAEVCLGEQGPIAPEVLRKVYRRQRDGGRDRDAADGDGGEELRFQGLDELQQFSFSLLQELAARHCYLLSKEAYNEGVRGVSEAEQLREIFVKFGDVISNHEQKSRRRGFFGRFFQ